MENGALLLDDSHNLYQQLLVREAAAAAGRHEIALLAPSFADGSAWTQVELANACLRQPTAPDAMMIMLAGGESARAPIERILRRYWDDGAREDVVLLEAESFPRLEEIGSSSPQP